MTEKKERGKGAGKSGKIRLETDDFEITLKARHHEGDESPTHIESPIMVTNAEWKFFDDIEQQVVDLLWSADNSPMKASVIARKVLDRDEPSQALWERLRCLVNRRVLLNTEDGYKLNLLPVQESLFPSP